ncbi:MAG: Crp/Fnr family transcriptional regulator [Pseudomonadota bacterium]
MPTPISSDDIRASIASSPWFVDLPSSAIDLLCQQSRVREFEKNSYLFSIGETTTDVFCLLSGRVRLMLTSELGQEFAITTLEAGAWINDAGLASDEPRLVDAQAMQPCLVLKIPAVAVRAVGDKHPVLYRELFRDHVQRTRGVFTLLQGMAFYPLKARLAGWLLELLNRHGQTGTHGEAIDLSLSQNELAQLSLGSRQRINKILGEWRERNIIELNGTRYTILNRAALENEMVLRNNAS